MPGPVVILAGSAATTVATYIGTLGFSLAAAVGAIRLDAISKANQMHANIGEMDSDRCFYTCLY